MSLPRCSIRGCTSSALLADPYCQFCQQYLCYQHEQSKEVHPCHGRDFIELARETFANGNKKPRSRRNSLRRDLDRVDWDVIKREAESLRPGHTCSLAPWIYNECPSSGLALGANINFPLTFDDGVRWMGRLRRSGPDCALPDELTKMVQLSEAATFTALNGAGLKVPKVYMTDRLLKDPETFVFFVECVEDNKVPDLISTTTEVLPPAILDALRVLAKFNIKLSNVSFDKAGTPTFDDLDRKVIIGPHLSWHPLLLEPPYYIGPFLTAKEHFLAHCRMIKQQVLASVYCPAKQETQEYLMALEVENLVENSEGLDERDSYIVHGEPKGDHILFSNNGDISGVIDWERSYTTSKRIAFAAPLCCLDEGWFTGSNKLSNREEALANLYMELGRSDLADCVRNGKKYQRLAWYINGDHDWVDLMAMRRAFGGLDDVEMSERVSIEVKRLRDEDICKELELRYESDEGLKTLKERQKAQK